MEINCAHYRCVMRSSRSRDISKLSRDDDGDGDGENSSTASFVGNFLSKYIKVHQTC